MTTLYLEADPGSIGEYVIFSGDPWRVEVVKQYLDDPVHIAFKREYNTYTGTYKGLKITVTSTGIGSPSAAIAMEEMYQCGMKTALRMGTVMALEDSMLGHFIIPLAAMRRESTSKTYVEESYPAAADIDLVNTLNETVAAAGKKAYNGITCTMDGFYSQMRESGFSGEWGRDINSTFNELKKMRVSGIDMETACMLTLGRLMGVKTAVLTAVTVLENLKQKIEGKERIELEDSLCRLALEGLYRFSQKNTPPGET
jgi:uridine phosphorylase